MKTHIHNIKSIYSEVELNINDILNQAKIKKDDEAILVYGKTRAGKSLLCHLLSGEEIVVEKHNSTFRLSCNSETAREDVSHENHSKTVMPKMFSTGGNRHFIDCPGTNFTTNTYDEIKQRMVINELLSKLGCKKKILLVIESSEVLEKGGQEFLTHMQELKAVPHLLKSASLLFTKVPSHIDIIHEVRKVIGGQGIVEDLTPLLEGNRVFAFPKPVQDSG